MALPHAIASQSLISPLQGDRIRVSHLLASMVVKPPSAATNGRFRSSSNFPNVIPLSGIGGLVSTGVVRASNRTSEKSKSFGGKRKEEEDEDSEDEEVKENDPYLMTAEERREWRSKIRDVMKKHSDVEENLEAEEKRKRMEKLLSDYPLVVEEEDPSWPDDGDGWGFNLGQFFDKITIKNKKKDDDEEYDSENEIVWQDDNYIRPIKDIKTAEWEEAVFKDISPLIVLVHNRYKRPKENERVRNELEKAVHIIWNCRLPSPRCVAIDAVMEDELVAALKVSVFPEIIFTKAGKILYREKGNRTADELSKIMAFFYYGAAKPNCLSSIEETNESIPARGYASSFRFSGDYVDKTDLDHFGRRRTRFITIDALCSPGRKQYKLQFTLREINKAFCGFWDESKHAKADALSKGKSHRSALVEDCIQDINDKSNNHNLAPAAALNLERKLEDKKILVLWRKLTPCIWTRKRVSGS